MLLLYIFLSAICSLLTYPTGKYLYIESTGRSVGDKALMTTAEMLGGQCLTFFYHMYGIVGMGSLQVNIVTNSGKRLVMKLSGNQGDEWKEAQVQIREDALYWVMICKGLKVTR